VTQDALRSAERALQPAASWELRSAQAGAQIGFSHKKWEIEPRNMDDSPTKNGLISQQTWD
jgi:hypothetical protein